MQVFQLHIYAVNAIFFLQDFSDRNNVCLLPVIEKTPCILMIRHSQARICYDVT
jgi:hypothetical protein